MSILLGSKYCLKHWIPNKWESRMKFWTWPIPKSFGFWGNQSVHGRSHCLFLYFYHSTFQMSANYQKVGKWQIIIWNMNEPPVGNEYVIVSDYLCLTAEPIPVLLVYFQSSCLLMCLGNQGWWCKYLGPYTHVDLDAIPGSCLVLRQDTAITVIWGIKQWVEDLFFHFSFLSISFCLLLFHVTLPFK